MFDFTAHHVSKCPCLGPALRLGALGGQGMLQAGHSLSWTPTLGTLSLSQAGRVMGEWMWERAKPSSERERERREEDLQRSPGQSPTPGLGNAKSPSRAHSGKHSCSTWASRLLYSPAPQVWVLIDTDKIIHNVHKTSEDGLWFT